jgi:hypothetical protein
MGFNRLGSIISIATTALFPMHSFAEDRSPVRIDGVTVTIIDAEELLAQRFKINLGAGRPAEDSGCPVHPTGSGFRAKTWCTHFIQFRDLAIDRITELKIGDIDLSKLPVSRKDERIEFENYWGDPYPFKQTVKYTSHQGATVAFSEVLTKIKDYNNSFDVNATVFKSIGIHTSEKMGHSINYSLTRSQTESLQEDFELTTDLNFPVPSCYKRWAEYSDEKRSVRIPVRVVGLISGRIVDWVPESKTETEIRKIDSHSKEDRSVAISGFLDLAGSNRSLSVKLGEEKLTDKTCAGQHK